MDIVDSELPQAWQIGENLFQLPSELRGRVFERGTFHNGFDALKYRVLNKFWRNNWGQFLPRFSYGFRHDPLFINQRPLINFPNAHTIQVNFASIGKECHNVEEFLMHVLSQPSLKNFTAYCIEDKIPELIEALKKNGRQLESVCVSAYRFPTNFAPGNELLQIIADFCPNVVRLDFSVDANNLACIDNLKDLRILRLGKASAAHLCSLRATAFLRCLEAEYAQLESIDSICLKPFTNLEYLVLGGGNVEQQDDKAHSDVLLKAFVTKCINLCSEKLPKQVGINCNLSINISDGQADDTVNQTLLGLSIECRNEECVKILVDAGVELINTKNNYVSQSIDQGAQLTLARLLVERGHPIIPFFEAILNSSLRILDSDSCEGQNEDWDDTQPMRVKASHLNSADLVAFLVDLLSIYAPREASKISSQHAYAFLTRPQSLKALADARSHERLWRAIQELPLLQAIRPEIEKYTV